ncbi:MAG TPA: exodeoxyribonuclease VII large subunit, partial [Cyclobacteriaceae bacterium]|nr:exodeoxyribonuclease VII large subunit [Cyclobacteriaceae bacterium]
MKSLSLLELNQVIRKSLEENLEPSYWVVAEISELKVNQKGHCYLELIEKKDEEILARARATIWSYTYRSLSARFETSTGEALRPGMKILANASVSFHELYGLSLNIREIDPSFSIGERARLRQEILKKLAEDGVADMNKELLLPLVPQRVAIISSPTAAGYQDFTHQLIKNSHGYYFICRLFKALMQGKEAETSIIEALQKIFKRAEEFDIVVLIRGGGGVIDLECFDSYQVASHVAQFPLPVITGIGHEKDETIVDMVAHTRLKTPTAVAEFLVEGVRKFEDSIQELFSIISGHSGETINREKSRLEVLGDNLKHFSRSCQNNARNMTDFLLSRCASAARNRINLLNSGTAQAARIIRKASLNRIAIEKEVLKGLERNTETLSPDSILKMGF